LNVLVKHLQVQQRRDAPKQPLLTIKVELKQLVFSIARCCSPLRLISSSSSSPSLTAACLKVELEQLVLSTARVA
jgi:hypothetical protein